MKSIPPTPRPSSPESLKAIPYADTTAAKPPISITVAKPPPPPSHKGITGLRRADSSNSRLSPQAARSKLHDDVRRDSVLAPSSSTTRDSRTTLGTDVDSASSIRHSPSLPSVSAQEERHSSQSPEVADNGDTFSTEKPIGSPAVNPPPLMSILTEIPTGSFEDLTIPGQVEFSKRGSMLIGGRKANKGNGALGNGKVIGSRRQPHDSALAPPPIVPKRVLSADDEMLSQKVRSMYEGGGQGSPGRTRNVSGKSDARAVDGSRQSSSESPLQSKTPPERAINEATEHLPPLPNEIIEGELESGISRGLCQLAGGIEDWEDLNGDVDRYGFIVPRRDSSQPSSAKYQGPDTADTPRIQRMSTLLQLASDAPRRQRSTVRKASKSPARSAELPSTSKPTSTIVRPASSQSSYRTINGKESRVRSAANRLPHNKDRRCVDEAGDMLTLPPGLADIAEDEEDCKAVGDLRKREREREEKWRKMAKIVKKDKHGGGMVFEFDTRNPKLVDRTWKGIPDRWRATAWHAFLTASAKKHKSSPSDEHLIAVFQRLVDQGSPDDVQIDIDVPRTINSHIMFRRRYRGGQRLLFRVLHCLSIYFPDTGYVQGMAALAATLLCYFDEEMTFVMLVRLWQLRGLERLYQSGFEGLMQALEEFEKDWLGSGEVSVKLSEFGITPTAYGTRWYLTLFNYSIPFPAQLRVWDVFMLLGDSDPPLNPPHTSPPTNTPSFNGGLDVLHAVSAALVDGTREILLDSDFENAMKVLTSWIPVKDEEMLMRVARVEWKMRKRRRAI